MTAESTQRDRWGELQRAVKRARCSSAEEAREAGNVIRRTGTKRTARHGGDLTGGGNDLGVGEGGGAVLVNESTSMISM